jgi:hypothetical protein
MPFSADELQDENLLLFSMMINYTLHFDNQIGRNHLKPYGIWLVCFDTPYMVPI